MKALYYVAASWVFSTGASGDVRPVGWNRKPTRTACELISLFPLETKMHQFPLKSEERFRWPGCPGMSWDVMECGSWFHLIINLQDPTWSGAANKYYPYFWFLQFVRLTTNFKLAELLIFSISVRISTIWLVITDRSVFFLSIKAFWNPSEPSNDKSQVHILKPKPQLIKLLASKLLELQGGRILVFSDQHRGRLNSITGWLRWTFLSTWTRQRSSLERYAEKMDAGCNEYQTRWGNTFPCGSLFHPHVHPHVHPRAVRLSPSLNAGLSECSCVR